MNEYYIKQINQAIDFIIDNLEEELTVSQIAKHCHFSKYYFGRLFKSVVGENLYSFLKRLRIEKSAFLLNVAPEKSITEIGAKFGYSSSNYSSAFKQHYKQSPVSFRKYSGDKLLAGCNFYVADLNGKDYAYYNKLIKIIELPNLTVIYERQIGNYIKIAKNWGLFLNKVTEFINDDTIIFDISYDDPVITDQNRCIYDMCITVDQNATGFSSKIIKGGKYASYSFEGPTSKIFEAYQGILKVWLPNTIITLDDREILSKYEIGEQKENNIKMDICIPIK